jgi:hypothetical protein
VVYRAADTKLNRDVAVKVLPDSFAADPDRLARFAREAQVALVRAQSTSIPSVLFKRQRCAARTNRTIKCVVFAAIAREPKRDHPDMSRTRQLAA